MDVDVALSPANFAALATSAGGRRVTTEALEGNGPELRLLSFTSAKCRKPHASRGSPDTVSTHLSLAW